MIEEEGYNSPEVGTFAYDEFYDYDRYTGWLEHLGRAFYFTEDTPDEGL